MTIASALPVVAFFVPGIPAPKPVGPPKRDTTGHRNYRAFAELCGLKANPFFRAPLAGPVVLSCSFYLPTPSSWSLRQVEEALNGHIAPIRKPDLKNLIAGVEDALNGLAWRDDAQVTDYGPMGKWYARDDAIGTAVRIYLADRGDDERLIDPMRDVMATARPAPEQ